MKLLFFQWSAFMQNDVEHILSRMDEISLTCVSYEFKNLDEDDYFLSRFPAELLKDNYDAVFSLNFFPLVSDLCNKYHIPYISWVYDAPMNVRRTESFANPVNTIYVFDGGQYNDLRARGFTRVFHKPLGVDTNKINHMEITTEDVERFSSDISFVGKLYSSDFDYLTAPLPENERQKLDKLVDSQTHIYGEYIIDNFLTNSYMEELNYYYKKASGNADFRILKEELEFALACEVTHRERLEVIKQLGSKYPVTLFSYDNSDTISGVVNRGTVNYYTEMPKVFNQSRINLNITLKIIKTGMPLRILDILGAGGFLMSNWQKELADNFTDGKDVVMYQSIDELVEKCGYYLSHEDERRQISINGHDRAHELFELEKLLKEIIAI